MEQQKQLHANAYAKWDGEEDKKERVNEYRQELEKLVEMRAEMDRKIEELRKKMKEDEGLL